MLDYALKNRLIGEYEHIFRTLGISQDKIPRSGDYGKIKDELIPSINALKVEA
jgi:hypothetical protein